jgi:hypothetical protein
MTAAPSRFVPVARALVACGLLGSIAAVAGGEWRSLPDALAARQLRVEPDSVHWLEGPRLGARRALVLARQGEQPADLYVVTARTGLGDRVISIRDVSNLTRSHNAEETSLVTDGRYAAYATRVGDEVVAFTVMDTRGDHAPLSRDWQARLRGRITRLQQTGSVRGYGIHRFDLHSPVREVQLALRGPELEVRAGREVVRVETSTPRLIAGASLVRARPRHAAQSDNWVTWTVDTVRALPWVGATPIAWAESVAFRARDVAVQARASVAGGADTQREVAEDLADVLRVHEAGTLEGPVEHWPPPSIEGTVRPALAHEGEWSPVARENDPFVQSNPGAPPAMYLTFVRTDPEREDSRVYVLLWDARQIELHVAPGSQEPIGATGETGSGAIPRDENTMSRLVAGFNGAFQGLHGEYGCYGEGALLLPPKPYAATVALLADGSTAFGSWPAEQQSVPDEVVEFRQNLTALVEQGRFNPWGRNDWGAIFNNPSDLRTARSALCLTREGHVGFFWGNDLHPRALGTAMLAAHCSYGVHLDMNGPNTGFEFYRAGPTGTLPPRTARLQTGEGEGTLEDMPGTSFRVRKLVRSMPHRSPRYILRNPRDFFYLLLRPVLPGPALTPPVSPAQPGEGQWHVAGLASVPFPWPLARTRVRPDAERPERWVNLVRVDPRRVSLAPPEASAGLVARVANATVVQQAGALRISMSEGAAGPRWLIGTEGDGIAGEPLRPGTSTLRGACVDGNGFLVMAVADRALPDLVMRALDGAGCGRERIALTGATLLLPSGETVAGESAPARPTPSLALVAREFVGARPMFTEVTPVPPRVWAPVQNRRVRYFPNPGNNVTVQVQLAGQQRQVIRLPGLSESRLREAYPDGGAPGTLQGN